jgi:hypothetical protein
MLQAQGCDCNDYSQLTANTGVVTIATANSNLDGSGSVGTVLTAAGNGTTVKSIIIKSTAPVTTGMVRLFIGNANNTAAALYREIPIPTYPQLACTPTPAPIWPMLEIDLVDELKLKSGYKLLASTQNAESFNIIAEGFDWNYPGTLPAVCCNFKQETAVMGLGTVTTANSELGGSGAIVAIFTAPNGTNGSLIKSITIAALQSTHKGMIRLFISPDSGTTYKLWMEILVPQTNQSAFVPSFKVELEEAFYLKATYLIGASTQIGEKFSIIIEGEDWIYP